MSYETYYHRYAELMRTYRVKIGVDDLLTPAEKLLPYNQQQEALRRAMEPYDVVIQRVSHGYASIKYNVLYNKPNLSPQDLAIICDRGNLCFGYYAVGSHVTVYTD